MSRISIERFELEAERIKQKISSQSSIIDQLVKEYRYNATRVKVLTRVNRVARDVLKLKIPLRRMILSKEFRTNFGLD